MKRLAILALLAASCWAPSPLVMAQADQTTPAGCLWMNVPNSGLAELWCTGEDGRKRKTGRFRDQGRGNFVADCPGRQVYDGMICKDEDTVIAERPAFKPRPDRPEEVKVLSASASALDAVITFDSQAWTDKRYEGGSVSGIKFLARSRDGKSGVLFGQFNFNQGQVGWIKARIEAGALACVEYHDSEGQCRPGLYSTDVQAAVVAAAVQVALAG